MQKPIAWTIAGSDPSGCAGIQADLKAMQGLGVHGCSVITAVTAQNSRAISEIQFMSPEMINHQTHLLHADMPARALKIGMLGRADIKPFLEIYSGKVVLDPVMLSTSGKELYVDNIDEHLKKLRTLIPYADILTPNLPEAEAIVGSSMTTPQQIEAAARQILLLGAKSVIIKGGHSIQDQFSQDYWTDGQESFWLTSQRYPHHYLRGTGCTLSAAITACLALGYPIKDALIIAKMYISRAIRLSESGRLDQGRWPEEQIDLPYLSQQPIQAEPKVFPHWDVESLGLYPVVDSYHWIEKLLPQGVKAIQLRVKDKAGLELEDEIQQSIQLANQYQAKLFINDYWQLAIRFGAYGVHLGQSDLDTADVSQIHAAGLRLGISTHCYYEVARAHAYRPSYMACGPIYATTSKIMPFDPQGIQNLQRWCRTLDYPIVAIGGINAERIPQVLSAKVSGVALISAITQAHDPIQATQQLLKTVNDYAAIAI